MKRKINGVSKVRKEDHYKWIQRAGQAQNNTLYKVLSVSL